MFFRCKLIIIIKIWIIVLEYSEVLWFRSEENGYKGRLSKVSFMVCRFGVVEECSEVYLVKGKNDRVSGNFVEV